MSPQFTCTAEIRLNNDPVVGRLLTDRFGALCSRKNTGMIDINATYTSQLASDEAHREFTVKITRRTTPQRRAPRHRARNHSSPRRQA
ncbi:hypothetical protein ABZ682_19030 [Streptomyces griseoviridis]|uniref:hypothetical protein n=1 Tax=Streptomyces griseoviridis TaxID=45398 RepID=UPI0033D887C7